MIEHFLIKSHVTQEPSGSFEYGLKTEHRLPYFRYPNRNDRQSMMNLNFTQDPRRCELS
jgi:hypothetical protein